MSQPQSKSSLIPLVIASVLTAGGVTACAGGTDAKPNEAEPKAEGDAKEKTAEAPEPAPAAEAAPAATVAAVGQPAPEFALPGLDGKTIKLSDYEGKTVALEWFNPGCPFVKYAHADGPLKDMATKNSDVVWIAINSGAPGKEGTGNEVNQKAVEDWSMGHPVLIDEDGAVGHLYGAEKTPHMYLIDAEGTLVYAGALDNAPIGEVDGGGELIPYFQNAIDQLAAGKPIETAETKAYGCSVKYGS